MQFTNYFAMFISNMRKGSRVLNMMVPAWELAKSTIPAPTQQA
jgi:hypothetical protein